MANEILTIAYKILSVLRIRNKLRRAIFIKLRQDV